MSRNDNSKGGGWGASASGRDSSGREWSGSARRDRSGGCCYAADTPVLMDDYSYQKIETLKEGDRIFSLVKEELVPVFVKNVNRSYNILHDVKFGHKSTIIQATADHKFKTRRGGVRVDHLLENDFLYMLQPDILQPDILPIETTFAWVSIESVSLHSRYTRPVIEIRTHESGNCIVAGVVGYNYSQFRQLREFLNRILM